MGDFAWRNLGRNNLFIPEYFFKDFYGLKLTTVKDQSPSHFHKMQSLPIWN